MNEPVIQTKELIKRFGTQTVLKGVNLDVRKGETMVVMGGSGCGKSTILRMMIGSLMPTSGSVELFGEDLATLDESDHSMKPESDLEFFFNPGHCSIR